MTPAPWSGSPLAAQRAAARGAPRGGPAVRPCPPLQHAAPELVGELSDHRAYACYLSGEFPEAIDAQSDALQHHRGVEDWLRAGQAARSLSLLLRYQGEVARAWEVGRKP